MRTVCENLQEASKEINTLLEELMAHSSINKSNFSSDDIVWCGPEYSWNKLDDEGRRIQSKCLEKYYRFYDILSTLLRKQPDDTLRTLNESHKDILLPIQQNEMIWNGNVQKQFSSAIRAINEEVALLKRLYDVSKGEVTLVPDTNALLHNPALEKWIFNDFSKFTILLTPTVLSELDSLKINHRNEEVRKKAERLINQFKEYGRRGGLTEGVTLVANRSAIMAVAVEPKMKESLPWLDSDNNDDRLLAGFIEIMRLRPSSPVLLVTRDINLQNKAGFARIIFIEPPDVIS